MPRNQRDNEVRPGNPIGEPLYQRVTGTKFARVYPNLAAATLQTESQGVGDGTILVRVGDERAWLLGFDCGHGWASTLD